MGMTVTREKAAEHLDAMWKAGAIAKTIHGDYMISVAYEDGTSGWTSQSPEDAESDLSCSMLNLDAFRAVMTECAAIEKLPEIDAFVIDVDDESIRVCFDSDTAFGEPVAWTYLCDGTSVEIVHEEYGLDLKDQYFSIRLHCSNEDFENDIYHETMGIIDQFSGGLVEIERVLPGMIHSHGGLKPGLDVAPTKISVSYSAEWNIPIPDDDLLDAYNGIEDVINRAVEEALDTLPEEIGNDFLKWHFSSGKTIVETEAVTRKTIPNLKRKGVFDEISKDPKKVTLSSKELAHLEDEFEHELSNGAYNLFSGCLNGNQDISFEEFWGSVICGDYHNKIKKTIYDLFKDLGYDIQSGGCSF